jgi:hypothetical protein
MTSFEYFTLVFNEFDIFLYVLLFATFFTFVLLSLMKATPYSYFYLIYIIPANVTAIFLFLLGYLGDGRWLLILMELMLIIMFVISHLYLLKCFIKLEALRHTRLIWFPVIILAFYKYFIIAGDKEAYINSLATVSGLPIFITMIDICSYLLVFHYSRSRNVYAICTLCIITIISGIGTGSSAGFLITCTGYIAIYLSFQVSSVTGTLGLNREFFRILKKPSVIFVGCLIVPGIYVLGSQFVTTGFVVQRLLMGSDITFSLATTSISDEVSRSTQIWRDLIRPVSLRTGDYYLSVGESIRQALYGGSGYGGVNFRIVPFTMLTLNYLPLIVACMLFYASVAFFSRIKVSLFSKHFLIIGMLLSSFYFYQDYYKFLSAIVLLTLVVAIESLRLLLVQKG